MPAVFFNQCATSSSWPAIFSPASPKPHSLMPTNSPEDIFPTSQFQFSSSKWTIILTQVRPDRTKFIVCWKAVGVLERRNSVIRKLDWPHLVMNANFVFPNLAIGMLWMHPQTALRLCIVSSYPTSVDLYCAGNWLKSSLYDITYLQYRLWLYDLLTILWK